MVVLARYFGIYGNAMRPYGKVLLFSQNLMHGNRINQEPETRWSMNCRFKSLFSPYAEKRLGEFFEKYVNPYYSAALQHVDDIIDPQDMRSSIIRALEVSLNKQDELPRKKHGNMPL